MQAHYLAHADAKTLLDPQSAVWNNINPENIKLEGTPLAMQPTAAIRESWGDRKIGTVDTVAVQVAHNGKELAFRLVWDAPNHKVDNGDNSTFPDGAAIAFPLTANAPVMMGAPNMPINIWFWRADDNGDSRMINAEGIGTSDTINQSAVKTRAVSKSGQWLLVIQRALQADNANAVTLTAGSQAQCALAIWDGSNQERGGIKSYSGLQWLNLSLLAGE
jgi:complex iron-sulfur molybdoenzyme family reductase subunit gamma